MRRCAETCETVRTRLCRSVVCAPRYVFVCPELEWKFGKIKRKSTGNRKSGPARLRCYSPGPGVIFSFLLKCYSNRRLPRLSTLLPRGLHLRRRRRPPKNRRTYVAPAGLDHGAGNSPAASRTSSTRLCSHAAPARAKRLYGDVPVHRRQVGRPEQLRTPVFQQNVHSRIVRISPAVLHGAAHPGKVALPVIFPHPHHGASTSFVSLHDL